MSKAETAGEGFRLMYFKDDGIVGECKVRNGGGMQQNTSRASVR